LKPKQLLLPAACGALLLGALLLVPPARAKKPEGPAPAAAVPAATSALPVHALTIQPQRFEETLVATGTLRADESVEVRAEISGKITQIHFQEGTALRRGDLLVSINDAELRASLQRATHRRELAELKAHRLATLVNRGGVPQQEYDIAASELAVIGAEVAVIEAQLEHTQIRAPFDGVVGLRAVSEGALVTPATRIASFQRLDRLKVDFSVPEKYAYRLDPAGAVVVTVAGRTAPLAGRIQAIEPLVDPATRTLQVRARCENPGGVLFSGGFVSVRLALTEVPDAILVPALALIPGAGDQVVFVVEDGHARQRVVKTGARTESAVQIVEGLRAGDALIVSGLQSVRPGLAVRVVADEPRSLHAGAAPTGPVAKAALN